MMFRWTTVILALYCGAGCGGRSVGGDGNSDGSGVTIVGDWFDCKDPGCTTLDNEGVRFETSGVWKMLGAPGSALEPGEKYCVEAKAPIGTYTYDGKNLTLQGGVPTLTMDWQISGNMATYQAHGSSSSGTMKRISPPRLGTNCP